MSNPIYTDNQVPIGSRVESILRGGGAGTAVGTYVFESINLDRPGKVVERSDELNQPNGWALVKGAETGSGLLQIGTSVTPVPRIGDWFKDQFDGSTGGAVEQWVITNVGQPFEKDGYYKANVQLRKSATPPTS